MPARQTYRTGLDVGYRYARLWAKPMTNAAILIQIYAKAFARKPTRSCWCRSVLLNATISTVRAAHLSAAVGSVKTRSFANCALPFCIKAGISSTLKPESVIRPRHPYRELTGDIWLANSIRVLENGERRRLQHHEIQRKRNPPCAHVCLQSAQKRSKKSLSGDKVLEPPNCGAKSLKISKEYP